MPQPCPRASCDRCKVSCYWNFFHSDSASGDRSFETEIDLLGAIAVITRRAVSRTQTFRIVYFSIRTYGLNVNLDFSPSAMPGSGSVAPSFLYPPAMPLSQPN